MNNRISIVEIYRQIQIKKEMEENKVNNKQIQVDNEGEWKPARVEEYIVPELNLPEKLTKPTRNFLSKVLTFIYSVRPLRYKDACTIMPISGTSKKNDRNMWQYQKCLQIYSIYDRFRIDYS